jgi:hypothetical protein
MEYKTVFELTDKVIDPITLLPLLFVVVGVAVAWFNIKYNKSTSPKRMFTIIFGFAFSGFALIGTLFIFPREILIRNKTKEMIENKEYRVVEGKIENFHPMPRSGHEVESFDVNCVHFEYSDYMLQYGFNNTASHGGPLKQNGQEVRLAYITRNGHNRIIRIELKQ